MISRIFPIIVLLAALGIFFGYVKPTYSGPVTDLRASVRNYDGALRAAAAYKTKEAQLIAEQNAISVDGQNRVKAFLPDGVDNVQLIVDLNALAARSGLRLSNFDIVETAAIQGDQDKLTLASEELVDSLEISMSARGTYDSFKTFLKGTEWSLRPLDLVSLSINNSTDGIYTYDITFRIYWLASI